MPYYHATYANRIDSIRREGLRGMKDRCFKNFTDCEGGAYLALDPVIAFGFLLELYVEKNYPNLPPQEALEEMRVIVIDDSRIDFRLLERDENFNAENHEGCFLYRGSIDVTAMPVITHNDIFAPIPKSLVQS